MQYKVTYTRPYLPAPDRFDVQRGVILADSEQQVRDIFADCEITAVELLDEPQTLSEAVAWAYGHPAEPEAEAQAAQVVRDTEWLGEAEAQDADWKDWHNTNESNRPI